MVLYSLGYNKEDKGIDVLERNLELDRGISIDRF